jgi:hypothetical protein
MLISQLAHVDGIQRKQPEASKSGPERCHQRISTADNGATGTRDTSAFKAGGWKKEKKSVAEKARKY